MSPREVASLQKLAVANGTTLTINPDTGLPEAFSLKDLLPTLAGAAINYFAPGFGTAIGGALGLSGAAGTGLAVGAATAALSGDLGKGLSAGLGAYGGAGITDGLMGLGTGALSSEAGAAATQAGNLSAMEADQLAQNAVGSRLAASGKFDTLSAGASKAMSDPMSAVKTLGGGSAGKGFATLGAALSPLLASETGNTVQTVTPRPRTGSIRPFTYDPYYQEYTRGTPYAAAKGGLMGLAHGGAVRYDEGGGITLDQAYQNVLGRASDTEGAKFWGGQFGDTVDENELATFRTSALGGTDTADKTAAQAFADTDANGNKFFPYGFGLGDIGDNATIGGAGAKTGAVTQNTASNNVETGTETGTGLGAGLASLTNNTATNNTVTNNTAENSAVLGTGTGLGAGTAAGTGTGLGTGTGTIQNLGTNYAGQATSPLITDQVQDMFRNVLDRTKANNTLTVPEIEYWSGRFGADNTIDASELQQFRDMAQGDITKRQASNNAYIPISGLDALYQSELGRPGEKAGLDFWKNAFGDYIDPTELAGFKTEAAKERAARTVVTDSVVGGKGNDSVVGGKGNDSVVGGTGNDSIVGGTGNDSIVGGTGNDSIVGGTVNPTVVTDLTTADTRYIASGVGGSTGAGQIGGGTVINPNGTITTSPRIPGIPVGGFTGMNQVRDAYTTGGGNLGYTSYAPKTIEEFNTKYKNTGYQKEMYDYLMGKGPKPTKMTDVDAAGNKTYREIMRPYNEATLGVPAKTNKPLNWNKTTGSYERNPDYVRTTRAPILDANGARKRDADGNYQYNTTTYKSINQAKAGIAENKLDKTSGAALVDWATTSNVDEQTVADALGIPLQEVIGIFAKVKADKKIPAKKGGLMQLANGGMAYDNGGGVKADYIDSKGDTHVWDWENGMYRPQKLLKNNKSYTWDKAANEYKLAAADAGLNSLLNTTDGSPAGGENAPNTTPDWDTTDTIGKGLSRFGFTSLGAYLQDQAYLGNSVPGGGVDPDTGLQGQGKKGQTGLYGDAAEGMPVGQGPGTFNSSDAVDTNTPSDPTGGDLSGPADSNSPFAAGGMAGYAQGGLGSLGGYSDGGRLLRGPGDGVSDSIPASIGDRQPARLADGEFVVPARIVSELGNGSTEAGARALYKMMDRIQANRRKTTGRTRVAVDSKSHKYLPA